VDSSLYVAMTGAQEILDAQAVNNFNLANVDTVGFKAEMAAFQSQAVQGSGYPARVYATESTTGWNDSPGSMITTGRPLDVAIQGQGFIAVQGPNGTQAYTRNGNLHIQADGLLVTSTGQLVLGTNGPISIPPSTSVRIGSDGTVSAVPDGQGPDTLVTIGRIKLVDPPPDSLTPASGDLFTLAKGVKAPADAAVRLASGVLESSNVDVADAMVNMIDLARDFELQVKVMKSTNTNAAASSQLLQPS
jgi:flagellar basal-body rod protein FlgF